MPGSRLYNFSLAQPQFEIQPFQAVAFEPKERPNISILSDAFDTIEKRENEYNDTFVELDASFAKLKEDLSPDSETIKWFENLRNDYKNRLRSFAGTGDYNGAAKFGKRLASELLNNKEYAGRKYSYKTWKDEYDTQKARLDKQSIRQETFDLWQEDNPYFYLPLTDEETGEIIGGHKYQFNKVPVDDISWATLTTLAKNMIETDSKSTGSSRARSWGRSVDGISKSGHKSTGSSSSRTELKKQEVFKVVDELFDREGVTQEAALQSFRADRRAYVNQKRVVDDLLEQLNQESNKPIDQIDENRISNIQRKLDEEKAILEYKKRLISDSNGESLENDIRGYMANRLHNEVYGEAMSYVRTAFNSESNIGNEYSENKSAAGGIIGGNPTGETDVLKEINSKYKLDAGSPKAQGGKSTSKRSPSGSRTTTKTYVIQGK